MIISKIELYNFRNYQYQDVEFSPDTNIVYGMNAQGKSNLLEAIYFLSHFKSKRTPRIRDLVREGEERSSVRILFHEGGNRITVKVAFGGRGKVVEVNGQRVESIARARGVVKCVLFSPDDLYMIKGDPARRREILDETAEEIGPEPAEAVHRYRHVLRQRNAILKSWEEQGSRLREVLRPWTEALVMSGAQVVHQRARMVGQMGKVVEETYRRISGEDEEVEFGYRGTFNSDGESVKELALEMREAVEKTEEEERRRRSTLVGPHRDDVEIRLGGKRARFTASQGEQRTLAFCMRVAQKRYIESETAKEPVMLLDDVLSELDRERRSRVLGLVGSGSQAIVTTADAGEQETQDGVKMFKVERGEVISV